MTAMQKRCEPPSETTTRGRDLRAAGVTITVSGALLVVALFFDWWGLPPAFENPEGLPDDVSFLAENLRDIPGLREDAFRFFEARDVLWLATGVVGFVAGLVMLTACRVPLAVPAVAGTLALIAGAVLTATLISPPDYADLVPSGGKPVDFGVELPLARSVGGYVALIASLGMLLGSGAAVAQLRSQGGNVSTS